MTVTSNMNQIVRPLESGARLAPDEVAKRARPPVRGILDLPGSLFGRRYGLRFGVETKITKSSLTLRDDVLDRHIVVDVHWHAKLAGEGTRLLEKLAVTEDDAQQVVEAAMTAHLNVRARTRGSLQLGQWLHNERIQLARELITLLATLDLDIWCELRTGEHKPLSVTVPPFTFDVRTKDSATPLPLTLDLLLEPTEKASELAPKHVDVWQKQLQSDAADYMQRHETIESYYRDPQLASRLRAPLDKRVADYGWKIIRFGITIRALPATATISEIFRVEWTAADGKVFGFGVKVGLDIDTGGIRAFDARGWPDLRAWTQENLQVCFKEVLFDRDKDKLSPSNFDEIRDDLQECLQKRASKLGLHVRTLIPNPEIEEWEYLSDRQYKVPAQNYASHNAAQNVNFEMTITGRFSTIGSVFKAKKNPVELKDLIAQVAAEAAANQMQQEEPRIYFSAFMPPPPEMPHQPPVPMNGYLRDRLRDAVSLALRDRLGFEVGNIHFLRKDPEVLRRVQELYNLPPQLFEVTILPEGMQGNAYAIPISVEVQFLAPPVDYIANYMSHDLSPKEMSLQIQRKIEQILEGMAAEELRLASQSEKRRLRNQLAETINDEMAYRGVCVSIESIQRRMSRLEHTLYVTEVENVVSSRETANEVYAQEQDQIKKKLARIHAKELAQIEKADLDLGDLSSARNDLYKDQQRLSPPAGGDLRQLTNKAQNKDKDKDEDEPN